MWQSATDREPQFKATVRSGAYNLIPITPWYWHTRQFVSFKPSQDLVDLECADDIALVFGDKDVAQGLLNKLTATTPCFAPTMVDTLASREEDIGTARSIENARSNAHPFEVTQIVPFSALIPSLRPSFSYFNKDVTQEEEENVADRSDTGTKRRFNEFGFSIPDFGKLNTKDLFRTMPNNACFSSSHSTGISRLRRVLRSLAWLYVDVGYCQGMGLIAANLLLCMEEETAFWMMCSIIEDLLPPSYYSSISLLGVQADQAVLCHLLPRYLPEVDSLLKDHGIELSLITLQWFLTLYASVCPTPVTFRIWDLFFYEGSVVLFRIALALLTMKKPELMNLDNPVQIFNLLSSAPGTVTDVNELIRVAYSLDEEYLDASSVSSLRRHYLAQLMVEESALLQPDSRPNLPKQYLAKRQLKRPRSAFSQFLHAVALSSSPSRRFANMAVPFRDPQQQSSERQSPDYSRSAHNGEAEPEDPKLKNVRQTEILVELKQAILMIVRHFRLCDPQHADASSQADYSMESHRLDLETYVQVAQHRRRRAKALMDFERQEPDELGFSKNDIITIINSDDEHCWVGELDGVRGWFPANFVELLDERGKNYSSAGDDAVNQNIASLVRGGLCTALSAVFTHGLRRPRLLGESGCHPWHFIEEAAAKEVERDFASVYSRLVLCKTFRLDEEGKVLSPEEVLYRAIHSINMSHDLAQAHMDVKFRSLVCYGLNEQLLHMWMETLCSSVKVVEKWYYPWSYLRSPGWVQIKCELRVLSQFAFHLSPIYELATNRLDTASETNSKTTSSRKPTRSMVTVNSLVDAVGAKPLRRLTKAAVAKDPMNDPPSIVSSFLSNTSTQDNSKELERTYRMVAGNTGDIPMPDIIIIDSMTSVFNTDGSLPYVSRLYVGWDSVKAPRPKQEDD
ncbi:small G protein signaling modulator 3 homolog [Clonorchis sinensis]|uniref:RUN and TBC1 domain-containing protein 3 n=1 Tax=Clonorchis sinensis TaxID=79923 RepID=G7Y6B0_CLOSI|nr:small G protein signaling modulator 3 homolog [Clonorchis sinensis]